MVTYIASIWAKPGHEHDVARFYQDLEPLIKEAQGYCGRRILRAQRGAFEAAVRKATPAKDGAGHAEPAGPKGTHFLMVEQWDSVDNRIAFARGAAGGRSKELFPHILPDHSHEFYEDITPG